MAALSGSDNNGGHAIPSATTASFDEPELFAASVTGFEARYLPITRDRRFTRLELPLESGRLVVVTRPPMLFEGAVVADHGVITFQLDHKRTARVNGSSVNADTMARWKKGTEYRAYQQSRLTHCQLFLSDAVAARGWPEPEPGHHVLSIAPNSSAHLRSFVSDVAEVIQSDPARIANPNVLKGMDRSIIGGVDDALSTFVLPSSSLATGRYLAICRRARDYLRESDFRIQSNVEVANACGVHVRTLHNAFIAVLGMSLRQYLLLHRLWLVRGALLRAEAGDLVKSIALDHGFWHLGRFSRLYQSRFGEAPSTTLARRGAIR
ncbi:AraC family transcriptional regulator [Bradyrhizobium sp.]|uniref:AraC family transcriptional regulator n=1 Tax=Bradyrhizobium sp. TaxID=376 RepID=UPI002606C30A|nr:AraC family transcriptional regulator [Bradyrhizobium sp.]